MILYLTGYMGTGKSTVAAELGKETGLPVLEMDAEIEREAGMKIPEIFAAEGEQGFRQRETDLLRRTAERYGADEAFTCIVSCGGGAVLSAENRHLMAASGKVCLLTASPAVIARRIGGDANRPNLKGKRTASEISALMQEREPYYSAAADFTVSTEDGRPAHAAAEILQYFRGAGFI